MAAASDGPTRSRPKDPAPQLLQLWVPSDASVPALGSYAVVIWRLSTQHLKEAPMRPGTALQEYRTICEFMRLDASLRFYQLALLLGTTGAIVTALLKSRAVHAYIDLAILLKTGGICGEPPLAIRLFDIRQGVTSCLEVSYASRHRRRGKKSQPVSESTGQWNCFDSSIMREPA